MKKATGILMGIGVTLLAFCVIWLLPTQAKAATPSFEEATIIADDVNMRLRPTVDSPFVLKLSNGTRVGVFCEEVDGWYRIIYGNYRGYVSKDYVFLPSTDMLVGNILADETPVKHSAGDFSETMQTLPAGMGVAVKNMQGDYYLIEYDSDVSVDLPEPTESAAPTEDAEAQQSAAPTEGTETQQTAVPTDGAEAQPSEAAVVDTQAAQGEAAAAGAEDFDTTSTGYIKKTELKISSAKNPSSLLKEGMKGAEIVKMQRELKSRGFLDATATGDFGEKTKAAVTLFQEMAALPADGIAGQKTLEILYSDSDITCTYAQRIGLSGTVKLTPWSEMDDIFYKGCVATVTDVKTGISWKEKRFGGWFHADSEPLTAEDTAKMKQAYGGEWSWDRRAVWVTIDGVSYAASINGMPHLSWTINDNNFKGHHCIHFYKSKVHQTSAQCPRHQAAVQYAYKMGTK